MMGNLPEAKENVVEYRSPKAPTDRPIPYRENIHDLTPKRDEVCIEQWTFKIIRMQPDFIVPKTPHKPNGYRRAGRNAGVRVIMQRSPKDRADHSSSWKAMHRCEGVINALRIDNSR